MFTIPEQFSNASKANLEAQLSLLSTFGSTAFQGAEQVLGLNLTTFKKSLDKSNAAAKQFFAVKDPQEFFTLATAQAQPNTEEFVDYLRNLGAITTGVNSEIGKLVESQVSETSRKVLELVEELSKNAPAGSENAIAVLKNAIGNANAGYEQFTKTAKQAAETLEANLNGAVSQFTQPAAATKASRKK
ncbi:phasin family protein [Oxalobacteraceae bacterium OM1]|nr:phasin family protein [Oxalobacteraceae bacterium OM1]